MYFSAAFGKFVGAECRSNSYGVTNTTYALGGYPCHFCSTGLQTSAVLAASSAHLQPSGYNSREACVTMKGYGFNSTDSTGFRCPVGSYNDEGNYGNCTTCPDGWTTQDDPAQQATSADCRIAPGYGYHTIQLLPVVIQAVIPCPIGESCVGFRARWWLSAVTSVATYTLQSSILLSAVAKLFLL
jgi:hypothetical protein